VLARLAYQSYNQGFDWLAAPIKVLKLPIKVQSIPNPTQVTFVLKANLWSNDEFEILVTIGQSAKCTNTSHSNIFLK
jgi:hypothetical protein